MATKATNSKSTTKPAAAKKSAPAKKNTEPKPVEPIAAPVPESEQPAEPEQPVEPETSVDPETTESKPETDGEEAIKRALQSEDKVRFYVPRDPTSGNDQFFERSLNGHIIRLRAGDTCTLPLWLVEYIEGCITIHRVSESAYSEFKTKNGKNLS